MKRAAVDADDATKMVMLGVCECEVWVKMELLKGELDVEMMGLEVFVVIVSEFVSGTASELGTTWERYEGCRASAEKYFLKLFFVYGCEVVRWCVEMGRVSDGSDWGVCVVVLWLMNVVLSWDFNRDVSYGFRGRAFLSLESVVNVFVKFMLGMEWRDVLLNLGVLDWLFDLYVGVESVVLVGGGVEAKRVVAASRKTLSAFCMFSGCVFFLWDVDDSLR